MKPDRFCIVELRDRLRVVDRYHDTFRERLWAFAFAMAPPLAVIAAGALAGIIR